MKAKKAIISIITMALAFLVVAVAHAKTAKVPNTNITIDPPPGWTVDTSSGSEALIVLRGGKITGFVPTINLVAEDIYGKSPDTWFTQYQSELAQEVKELHIINKGHVKLNDVDYMIIEFRGTVGTAPLHFLQAIHIQEGKAWIFTGTILQRYADKFVPRFQKAFSSIYFPPPPPGDFRVASADATAITVAWTDVSNDETGFVIQRRNAAMGSYQTISTGPPDAGSFSDSDLGCGTKYRYRIKTLNPRGDSNWSKDLSASTAPCPEPEVHEGSDSKVY